MSPASQKQIEDRIKELVAKLPIKEQKKWLPIKRHSHPNLGKHIAAVFRDNPRSAFTTRAIAELMTQALGTPISTGSAYYYCNKLMLSQDIHRNHDNLYQWRPILHLTCVDPAEADIKRKFKSESGRTYYLELDPYGQLRWVTEDPESMTWRRVASNVRFVLS